MHRLGTRNQELGTSSSPQSTAVKKLVANCYLLVSSDRGYLANKVRVSGVEVVVLSPALTLHSPALWSNHMVSARGLRSFFAPISTGIFMISSLLVPYFSPLSTGPINNNYKVYK